VRVESSRFSLEEVIQGFVMSIAHNKAGRSSEEEPVLAIKQKVATK
jgi:hypothetical protein